MYVSSNELLRHVSAIARNTHCVGLEYDTLP